MTRLCSACRKPTARFACGRCHRTFYCSDKCQTQHWQEHRVLCLSEEQELALEETGGVSLMCVKEQRTDMSFVFYTKN